MSANSERVKRWRGKNRALWNLRRRNARKNLSGVVEMQTRDGAGTVPEAWASQDQAMSPDVVAGAKPAASVAVTGDWKRAPRDPASSAQPAQTSKEETLSHLRSLIKQEEEKPASEPPAAPTAPVGGIYRNDQGGVISKFAWEKLQRLKEKAKQGGYTLDEYSQ